MAFVEMDACFTRAIRYLHSSASDSQNNLRALLDEAIRSKYGPGKEIGAYIGYSCFSDFPPATANPSSSASSIPADPAAAAASVHGTRGGEGKAGSSSDNELELDLLKEDLMCIICKGMGVAARNRLVECIVCHNLYHQECHDPSITEDELESSTSTAWTCSACKQENLQQGKAGLGVTGKKAGLMQVAANNGNNTSGSSNQLLAGASPKFDKEHPDPASSTSIKLQPNLKSSSSSSIPAVKHIASTAQVPGSNPITAAAAATAQQSSAQGRILTPNINIISADKRLQIMKKKAAAKHQEKRKLNR